MVSELSLSKNVCVIGAGPSGLVAARELRKEGHRVVVLEQKHDVGGQWLYEPNVEKEDCLGRNKFLEVHSSIYESLRLVSPREIMGYTDFPFLVKKGMDTWKRKQMHSHIYRVPEPFRNEVVVVVGNSLSGQDISMELVQVAKEVHLSAKSLEITPGLSKVISNRENLHLRSQIEFLEEDGRVVFADGSQIIADTILYCTGYTYTFPFLDTKGIVSVEDGRVGPLYEHTFPPSLAPSLSFIGIPRKIIGFPFFESQAKWIAQLLSGKRRLPSWDEMILAIKEFYQSRDASATPKHNTHDIADFEYCDRYADHVGFPHLEEWRKQLCISALVNADANLETYRDSWDDHDLLQEALQSPHFTRPLGVQDFTV
ncbi:flavin-containing monooxygenase FMO GS-OX-like 8 isoform X2 [Manihot esculenta]|uniref:flavin-containing monooxygenase FMO GS-OX-like 8 isoform X2 n=1 Tax=Manihot esculenta TaxID=3983 RepID=UPI001CC693BF|nr:flavin-containing monooxygenase FMO GS-OX-like 8 isoform X2 [Manihot esculenta]